MIDVDAVLAFDEVDVEFMDPEWDEVNRRPCHGFAIRDIGSRHLADALLVRQRPFDGRRDHPLREGTRVSHRGVDDDVRRSEDPGLGVASNVKVLGVPVPDSVQRMMWSMEMLWFANMRSPSVMTASTVIE